MAHARRSGRPVDLSWIGTCGGATSVDLAADTAMTPQSLGVATGSFTVMRLRGHIYVQLDSGAVDERALLAFGIMPVSDDAFAAGAASMPSPSADLDASWMWHAFASVSSGAFSSEQPQAGFMRIEIDGKAMRRLKSNETLALLGAVCTVVDATGTWDLLFGARILCGS